jgi:hypothetical protein
MRMSTLKRSAVFCRRWASLDASIRTGGEGLSGLQARGHAARLRRAGRGSRRHCAPTRIRGRAFVFRSKRGDYVKILTWDGSGLCLFAKRLEKGRFVWPPIVEGALHLTSAQLALLVEGIDWRWTVAPEASEHPSFL